MNEHDALTRRIAELSLQVAAYRAEVEGQKLVSARLRQDLTALEADVAGLKRKFARDKAVGAAAMGVSIVLTAVNVVVLVLTL